MSFRLQKHQLNVRASIASIMTEAGMGTIIRKFCSEFRFVFKNLVGFVYKASCLEVVGSVLECQCVMLCYYGLQNDIENES